MSDAATIGRMLRPAVVLLALSVAAAAVVVRADDAPPPPATSRPTQPLPTTLAVLDRYLDVTGGAAAHASVRGRRSTGLFVMPDLGVEGTLEWLSRGDGPATLRIDLPGIGTVRQGVTLDGITWTMHPTDGPRLLSGDEAAAVRRSLRMESAFDVRGYRDIRISDVVSLNDRPAYRMRLIGPDDIREQRFFDVESGLLVRTIVTIPPATGPTTSPVDGLAVSTFFGDYADVPPIRVPLRIRQGAAGLSPELILRRVELNVDLPDAAFDLPAELAPASTTRPRRPATTLGGNRR